jgi:hypothetical protein
MSVLLDTHTFILGYGSGSKIVREGAPAAAGGGVLVERCQGLGNLNQNANRKFVAAAAAGAYLVAQLLLNDVRILHLTMDHVLRVEGLELHHRDPFDRILIAQSLEGRAPAGYS